MARQFLRNRLHIAQQNMAHDWKKLKKIGFAPAAILLLGVAVTTPVSLAAFYGALSIVMEKTPAFSATESIGLALLSAALAAVILLLIRPQPVSPDGKSSRGTASRRPQAAEIIGHFLIVAAMAFALFGLLSPFLGAVSQGQRFFPQTAFGNFSEVLVKWVAGISLMIGTGTLVIPLIFGPFLFVSDMLRKKKKDD